MQLDFSDIEGAEAYRWLASTVTPRPIAWVSTLSSDGVPNLAPFSFFQVICEDPPTLLVNVAHQADGRLKDTAQNAGDTGELVIHLVSRTHAEIMNATAATLEPRASEFDHAHIATVPSARIKPVRIADAAVAYECEMAEIKPYPADNPRWSLIFARVLVAHIDDSMLADARHIDIGKLDTVGRLGGSDYATTRDRFALKRPP